MARETTERLLKSKNHFETLGLEFPSTPYPMETIKKQYKKFALLVHPDKCKEPKASDAFKVLGKAFESLSSLSAQLDYIQSTRGFRDGEGARKKKRGRENLDPEEFVREMRRRKEASAEWKAQQREKKERETEELKQKMSSETVNSNAAAWQRWQKQNFKKTRGNTFSTQKSRSYQHENAGNRKRDEGKGSSKAKAEEQQEQSHSFDGDESHHEESENSEEDFDSDLDGEPEEGEGKFICFICLRRFPSTAALHKHQQLSPLHHINSDILQDKL